MSDIDSKSKEARELTRDEKHELARKPLPILNIFKLNFFHHGCTIHKLDSELVEENT